MPATAATTQRSVPSAPPAVDHSERDRLILENLPLVRAIAAHVCGNLPVHTELDDLVHAGVLGLFEAATNYKADKQVTFKAYAKHRIKGAILDSLRDMDWASRDLRRRHKRLEEVKRELASTMEGAPTEEVIAEKMGMDLARWRQVAVELQMVGLVSASVPDDEKQSVLDFPATDALNPDVLTGQRELHTALAGAMKDLPARYQIVIRSYYVGGKTMREIGKSLSINESRVSQIHKTSLELMAGKLQAAGIHSAEAML
jgi:RNA polymerase sigma factor for flagellar operon FliA